MSTAVVSTPAANGRFFAFEAEEADSEAVIELYRESTGYRSFPGKYHASITWHG
jgi:hypothetical protein